jgi:hypothetical protein
MGAALLLVMDWLTFSILPAQAVLSFPVAAVIIAVIIVFVFRQELRQLFSVVRRVKFLGLEAELSSLEAQEKQNIREATEQSEIVTTSRTEEEEPFASELKEDLEPRKATRIELARIHPRFAILDAWSGVEAAVMKAALQVSAWQSPNPDVSSPLKALRELDRENAISFEDVNLFHSLRGLRNQVAHLAAFEPRQATALEYVEAASQLEARLRKT